ncbi:response regulator [Halomonas sp. CKK8]|uniref:response regulator transcription factor n=1 Tax=Halomonas sp. CKK8 TaxID=3036127 RepID=UPI002414F8D2|nr:response regulator [Halomonas sp. CKK8]WFM72431.1 response regulator [Halomonas sp. CKK8]
MTNQATSEPRVYVVEDDDSVRRSLGRLLMANGYAVACHESAESMLTTLPKNSTGCALLDIGLPDMDGVQLQALLATHSPALAVIFLTGHGELGAAVNVMKHGAVDYLIKPASEETLLPVVREALRRSACTLARLAAEQRVSEAMARLTRRELEVLEHVVGGRLNKQIAADLGIAEKTVKVHRSRVMAKMRVRSVAELARQCQMLGIVGPHLPEEPPE